MSTPFPFTQQHRVAPVIVSHRYHSIPNICAKYIPNELLQLNNGQKKKKKKIKRLCFPTPMIRMKKKKKKRSLRSFFKRRITCCTAFAPISFVEIRLPFSPPTVPSFCTRDTPSSPLQISRLAIGHDFYDF